MEKGYPERFSPIYQDNAVVFVITHIDAIEYFTLYNLCSLIYLIF